jgi:hypothetical protein
MWRIRVEGARLAELNQITRFASIARDVSHAGIIAAASRTRAANAAIERNRQPVSCVKDLLMSFDLLTEHRGIHRGATSAVVRRQ